jgi:hypothetical protein
MSMTEFTGQTYGEGARQRASQRMVPTGPSPTAGMPPGGGGGGEISLPPFDRPTEFPDEPVTALPQPSIVGVVARSGDVVNIKDELEETRRAVTLRDQIQAMATGVLPELADAMTKAYVANPNLKPQIIASLAMTGVPQNVIEQLGKFAAHKMVDDGITTFEEDRTLPAKFINNWNSPGASATSRPRMPDKPLALETGSEVVPGQTELTSEQAAARAQQPEQRFQPTMSLGGPGTSALSSPEFKPVVAPAVGKVLEPAGAAASLVRDVYSDAFDFVVPQVVSAPLTAGLRGAIRNGVTTFETGGQYLQNRISLAIQEAEKSGRAWWDPAVGRVGAFSHSFAKL